MWKIEDIWTQKASCSLIRLFFYVIKLKISTLYNFILKKSYLKISKESLRFNANILF